MQKRCSIFIMPQQRSGSSLRTFFVSTWTAYWFTHHVRLLMREHFQLVMNKLLNVSDLTNGTFNFVCEVSSSPTSKFVCLLDLLALLWCILWTQSIALKGACTWMLHRFFHRHERHKHMFVNGQSSPNRFRFSILWAFLFGGKCVFERKESAKGKGSYDTEKLIDRYQTHCRARNVSNIVSRGLTLCFRDNFSVEADSVLLRNKLNRTFSLLTSIASGGTLPQKVSVISPLFGTKHSIMC